MPENLQVAGKTVAQADLSFLKAGIAQRLRLERFEDALVESLQIACLGGQTERAGGNRV
jgi:hypothetical protein